MQNRMDTIYIAAAVVTYISSMVGDGSMVTRVQSYNAIQYVQLCRDDRDNMIGHFILY